MTVLQLLQIGEKALAAASVDQPRWNAERLLMLALQQNRAQLYASLQLELAKNDMDAFERLLQKRAAHYPLAYLEGTQEFFGRSFVVNESVLIPRPETEEIIRAVLNARLPSKPFIADLGAGSGSIAVTLALELPDAFVIALELSAGAVRVLQLNARHRVAIVRADLFKPTFLPESLDVITANLPYVEESTYEQLPPETRWEPRLALLAGDLEQSYARLLEVSCHALRRSGYLVFEIGYGQSERIRPVCAAFSGFELLEIRNDLNAIPRAFVLQKK